MADDATTQQPISDDQELAKVLAGVTNQVDGAVADATTTDAPIMPEAPEVASDPAAAIVPDLNPVVAPAPQGSNELESIKLEALQELRPLVDKLNVSPEEKFDTYLLLLRSTDDKALIEPAHEAARAIADETRRAQALLDVIKEIDFLSNNQAA